jgi:hypothetical protein
MTDDEIIRKIYEIMKVYFREIYSQLNFIAMALQLC